MADNTGPATAKQISYLNALRAKHGLPPISDALTVRAASSAINNIKGADAFAAEIARRRALLGMS